ncbi:hypothetical protein [uncultured Jannaschia sp.]|uniref:hypothetical protein n=1 Tax=Jannaschia halovivens TaxID=3388667 RepID=UPI0026326DF7|nr:hypothetical protein [uncultured Jannaschia sp.]
MKTIILTAALTAFAAPAFATDAISHFNQSKERGDVIVVQNGGAFVASSRGQHSARAQAIFDRIAAESAENE